VTVAGQSWRSRGPGQHPGPAARRERGRPPTEQRRWNFSAVKPAGCCWPATPCTPTFRPAAPISDAFGWLLAMLGQEHGFPTPVSGVASWRGARPAGQRSRRGHPDRAAGRADRRAGPGGRPESARRRASRCGPTRVVAEVSTPALYCDLLPADAAPPRLHADLHRFARDTPVLKVNWALDGGIAWRAPEARGRGNPAPRCGRGRTGPVGTPTSRRMRSRRRLR
jgi:hypothetical protein